MRRRDFVVQSLSGSVVLLSLAATPGQTVSQAARAATTQAAHLVSEHPEIAAIRKMVNAGDPRAIPTLLLWLASELDGQRIDSGTDRLRAAISGARDLRVKEALPYLIAVYDTWRITPELKNRAAEA